MKALLILFVLCLTAMILPAADNSTNVSPDEAEKLLKENPAIVVLDVRTADEFKDGHLKGATNLDFFAKDFPKQLDTLDKSKTYLIHCASGGRSSKVCKLMGEDQFAKVYHLPAGFSGWEKAGKPVEK